MFLFSVVVAALWMPGQSQHVQALIQRLEQELEQRETYQVAMSQHPNILDQIAKASEAIDNLWTVHFRSVLDRDANTSNSSVSARCMESVDSIVSASLQELIPLLDATGKPGPGVLRGNVVLNAAFDECFEYDYTSYCVGAVSISLMPTLSWTLGLCTPKYCTSSDVATVLNGTGLFDVNENLMLCTDTKSPDHYSSGAIAMIFLCSLFASLVLLGTVVDKILEYIALWSSYKRKKYTAITPIPCPKMTSLTKEAILQK